METITARRAEAEAFTSTLERWTPDLYRLALRMTASAVDAEDVLQESYTRAYEALRRGAFDGRASLRTWLYAIVVRTALTALERRQRSRALFAELGSLPTPSAASPELAVELRELAELLNRLPPKQRTALVLRVFSGLSSKQAAAIMECSEGAVEQLLVRARAALRAGSEGREEERLSALMAATALARPESNWLPALLSRARAAALSASGPARLALSAGVLRGLLLGLGVILVGAALLLGTRPEIAPSPGPAASGQTRGTSAPLAQQRRTLEPPSTAEPAAPLAAPLASAPPPEPVLPKEAPPSHAREAAPLPPFVATPTPSTPGVSMGPVGIIRGEVLFAGVAPAPVKLNRQSDPVCASAGASDLDQPVLVKDGKLANVLVRISTGARRSEGSGVAEVEQLGCAYRPRVQGAQVGQRLVVKNGDRTLHNIHSYRGTATLGNRAQPPSASPVEQSITRRELGVIKLKCDVHPWMAAYVIVSEHPFFATTDATGAFTLENVPPGSYTLEAWHEKLGTQTTRVTVRAGREATASFTFPQDGGVP